jgi:glycosyltransferase involved in cell wall biosynthesis/GT2 family glycosyltransferase
LNGLGGWFGPARYSRNRSLSGKDGVIPVKVLRVAHHAVVSEWRQRERELRALGIDVSLISARRWNEGGVDVALAPNRDEFVHGAGTVGRHPSVFLYNPFPIWRQLSERPGLIDIHEEPNSLATAEVLLLRLLRRSRAPFILYSAQNLDKRYPIPFRWFERYALRRASAVYVCNYEAGEILKRKGLRGRAAYLPLGVDLGLFAPAKKQAPAHPTVIGYVGRLERHKGVDVLLRALARTDDWCLRITGDGPARADLVRLAVELGITDRVDFLGHAGGETVAPRYRELDLLAVPSLPWPGWSEQFCRVAVEAMASGVPVVASDSGAIPDVVGDAGVLVAPGDPEALELGLRSALDTIRWNELRAAGLVRAASFSWQRVAVDHVALYRDVLGDSPVPAAAIEVIVVAYGPPELLAGCLSTLGDGLPVTVVDNSSLDATRQVAEASGANYVDAGRNVGFAAGVNLGIASIAGKGRPRADLLLLNPDARVDFASVHHMQAQLRSGSKIAAVGATQTEPGTGCAVRVWWPFPSPFGSWMEAIGFGGLRRRRDFAIGSVLLLRSEAVEELGTLDERFFLYAEEVDWQYRARRQGWSIEVADVPATHQGGGTGGDPEVREAHFYGSAERFVRKHHGRLGWQSYRAANLLGATVRGILLSGERGAAAQRRRRIFWTGPAAFEDARR